MKITPHAGAQTRFLSTPADIAIGGGAAGGGKSYGLLLEATRHISRPDFRAVLFRRTSADLRKPGGLWDTSRALFTGLGGRAKDALLEWHFPSGAFIKFCHLEHEGDRFDHQGAQYGLVAFDEVTHFSSSSFWYLVGRARASASEARRRGLPPLRPYIRATCNPDPDSFMADLISWWIGEDGIPIPERAGALRWFVRDGDDLVWADDPEALARARPHLFFDTNKNPIAPRDLAKSITFIPSKLTDNPSLGIDYEATLRALPYVERMRLLYGNWLIRESAGTMFREEWFPIVDDVPPGRVIRYWDLAGSKRRRSDFTSGTKIVAHDDGTCTIVDVKNEQRRPLGVEQLLRATADDDGRDVEIHIEQETGASGELLIDSWSRGILRGFSVTGHTVRGAGTKLDRAKPYSSAAEKGHVRLKRASWNRPFLAQHQAFPDGPHDDMVDSSSGSHSTVQESDFAFASGNMGGRR